MGDDDRDAVKRSWCASYEGEDNQQAKYFYILFVVFKAYRREDMR